MADTLSRKWIDLWANRYPVDYDQQVAKLAGQLQPRYRSVEAAVHWKSARTVPVFAGK